MSTYFIMLHVYVSFQIQVITVCFTFLAYMTIAFMSLERLIIFHSPHFYLRHCSPKTVRRIVCAYWLILSVVYFSVRFGICFLLTPNATVQDVTSTCNYISYSMFFFVIFFSITVSTTCYIKIYRIVKAENVGGPSGQYYSTARSIHQYRATSIVFLYLLSVIGTSLLFIVLLLLNKRLSLDEFRLFNDIINSMNCIIDPCLYVVWFKECRMELFKMMCSCLPSFTGRVEDMRRSVFQVCYNTCRVCEVCVVIFSFDTVYFTHW